MSSQLSKIIFGESSRDQFLLCYFDINTLITAARSKLSGPSLRQCRIGRLQQRGVIVDLNRVFLRLAVENNLSIGYHLG